MTAALEARALSLGYRRPGRVAQVVADVSLSLDRGRIVGLAGESGCGKSTLALALTGYRAPGAVVLGGDVALAGRRLTGAPDAELRGLWGARVAYLPQDSSTALNPALRIGRQLAEPLHAHLALGRADTRRRSLDLLDRVQLAGGEALLRRYPHELSGGERQRVSLAIAVACDPEVLILDEPTTGLDSRAQAAVVALIAELSRELGTATLLVSHDLALLASVCDELLVMYAGELVERGPAAGVYAEPRHPYTSALLSAIPTLAGSSTPLGIPGAPPLEVRGDECRFLERCPLAGDDCRRRVELVAVAPDREVRCVREQQSRIAASPAADDRGPEPETALLDVRDLRCVYPSRGGGVVAVDGVSVSVARGRTLGIAGESGSGKTTLLWSIAGLVRPRGGEIALGGAPLAATAAGRTRAERRAIQLVFQNPDSTLNPRHTVMSALARPLSLFRPEVGRAERRRVAAEMLERVHLDSAILDRLPWELSAGQRQRAAIARALIARPEIVLCDEITASLDVSVQAAVLELLCELRDADGLTLVFVTHDLGVLRWIADEVVVLEAGNVRERGATLDLLRSPMHPYTAGLIGAVPDPGRARETER